MFKKVRMSHAAGGVNKAAPKGLCPTNKRQKLTASDVTELEVAKTLVPSGIKLGKCNLRSRWYSRDDSIGFSCEKKHAEVG